MEMPATQAEVSAAEEEGIDIIFLVTPIEIIAEGGSISGMKCIRMRLGEPDANGRRCPMPIEGSEFAIAVDMVIPALGQKPDLELIAGMGLELSSVGSLMVDAATLATNIESIFAGGEVVGGVNGVVDAMAAGKRAARSIDNHLNNIPLAVGQTENRRVPELTEDESRMLQEKVEIQSRVRTKALAPKERIKTFEEVKLGFDPTQAQEEARRCLKCECRLT
jgi:NADPH-dependent glutamate synthase beta subunit-like oxidoreductase